MISTICLLFLKLVFVFSVLGLANGVNVKIKVPQYKFKGESAKLQCLYDLGPNKVLYSVRWYKDNEEFYRFIPKSKPPQSSYTLDGVFVDILMSDSHTITLMSLDVKSSGLYKCEVTAEAPYFESGQSESELEIIVLSKEEPYISGMAQKYQLMDTIELNCTSGKSYPASRIIWYINDKEAVTNEYTTIVNYESESDQDELIRVKSTIHFKLNENHFKNGIMNIRCISYIFPLWYQNNTIKTLLQKKHQSMLMDKREAMILVKNGAMKINCVLNFIMLIGVFATFLIQ